MSRAAFALLLVLIFLTALDLSIIGPALNTVAAQWALSERALSWGIGAYVLAYLIGLPICAHAADVRGRRPVLLAAITVFVAGSALAAWSPTFGWLLAGRALQGIGAGGAAPVVVALIGDALPADRQASALGLTGVALGVGFIAGPVIGGLLLQISWRLLFLVNLPLGAIVLAGLARALPVSAGRPGAAMDWVGIGLLTGAFAALAIAINALDLRALGASLRAPTGAPLLAAAAALGAGFVAHARRSAHPVLDPRLLARRPMLAIYALGFGGGLGRLSVQFVPRMLVLAHGIGDTDASLMLVPAAASFVVASLAVGRLLRRFGPVPVVVGAGAVFAAGVWVTAGVPASPLAFYAGSVALSCGLAGISGPPLVFMINQAAPAAERASAQGLLINVQIIGQLTGSSLIGAIAASWGAGVGGYTVAYRALAIEAAAMALLAAVALGGRRATAARAG
ncbi:MAG TPA: MFS transporter [Kofleriaceae bacterium]